MPASGSWAQQAHPGLFTRPEWVDVCRGPSSGLCEYSYSGPFSCSIMSFCASECGNIYTLWMVVWAAGGGGLPVGGTPDEFRDRL